MLHTHAITQRIKGWATGAWQNLPNHSQRWPLHDVQATRQIEQQALSALPCNTLMQRAGLATAQLALAIAPHAQRIWIACGPGNNGGDGLAAAVRLQQWGKTPIVTCTTPHEQLPADAQHAWQHAVDAGVRFEHTPPKVFDLALDALLGIGCRTTPQGVLAEWLQLLHGTSQTVLHIDIPSGLLANTGEWLGKPADVATAHPRHTLSLLTLKPGLFTADGRDACGQVWFNDLGIDSSHTPPNAWLPTHLPTQRDRQHSSHKGSYGDVMVVGGTSGMAGAAVLASLAALHGGAGRVFAGLLDSSAHAAVVAAHPALMVREVEGLDFKQATVVCGCGGGDKLRDVLPRVMSTAPRLVLDADALNALAHDSQLFHLLKQRNHHKQTTVLTPHPLEAARLLKCNTADVQRDRLTAAQTLAETTGCVIALKGSGTVIADNARTPVLYPSGNAKLATAGTGDVLAGLIGAQLANHNDPFEATCIAVYRHGALADEWPEHGPALTASQLVAAIR